MDPDLVLKSVTAAVALGALFRPEIERIFRRRASRLELDVIGSPEFGYAGFGPTIGIIITVTSLHSPQHISKISCQVRRRQDGSQYTLPWILFRPPEAVVTSGNISDDTTIQAASPFLITIDESVTKNIIFHDEETFVIIKEQVHKAFRDWEEFKRSRLLDSEFNDLANRMSGSSGLELSITQTIVAYNLYKGTDNFRLATQIFRENCYWRKGNYRLQINIDARAPGRARLVRHSKEFDFEITDKDHANLLENFEIMTDDAFLSLKKKLNFVYARVRAAPYPAG